MTITLNETRLWKTVISVVLMFIGMIIMRTPQQYSQSRAQKSNRIWTYVGSLFFILGWLGIGYTLSLNDVGRDIVWNTKAYAVWSIIGINIIITIVDAWAKKTYSARPKWMNYLVGVWVILIILLGYLASVGRQKIGVIFGVIGMLFVSVSIISLLPWQRTNCLVDGPGVFVFILGWGGFILANSLS